MRGTRSAIVGLMAASWLLSCQVEVPQPMTPTSGSMTSAGPTESGITTFDPTTGPLPGTTSSGPGPGETTSSDGDTTDGIKLDVLPPGSDVPPPPDNCDTLVATIRDFSHAHPDFETFVGTQAYPGLVLPDLGGDGRPALDPAYAGTPMITSAMTFAQWYQDVAGTNFAFEVPLPLLDEGTGELVFDSAAFFPINGFGFGNEGFGNNFHFTTEVRTSFTYSGGELFSFRGDDDIWVFVDGQLALDLGGLHPPLEATIDMDTLSLTVGQTYAMDIFHAERHTDQSNFRIVTTIDCFDPPG